MSAGLWEHQKEVFERLVASGIAGGSIYDAVPESDETIFPYVEIGESVAEPQDTDDSSGTEQILTLHIWSRHAGMKEVNEISDAIHSELHGTVLSAAGRDARIWWQGLFTTNDPDGLTRHGVLRLKISSYS